MENQEPIDNNSAVLPEKPLEIRSEININSQKGGLVKPIGKNNWLKKVGLGLGVLLIIFLGIASGYALSLSKSVGGGMGKSNLKREVSKESIGKGTVVGVPDEKTFKDSTEGDLEKGGIEGEGSHHLVRPGGESQYVYLTSSIIDLDQFVGRKVKIWGQTFSGQKAGWLMDVGKLEVLE